MPVSTLKPSTSAPLAIPFDTSHLDNLMEGADLDCVIVNSRHNIQYMLGGYWFFEAVDPLLAASPLRDGVEFVAHGMGIIGHEASRLTSRGPVKYPAIDADLPLQVGMVLSIETTLPHPTRGYLKMEDTVIVTADGCVGAGDAGRGWNRTAA